MHEATGTSYAKIILIGEHAVVYDQPAIALPVKSIQLHATIWPRADQLQQVSSLFYNGTLAASHQTRFGGVADLLTALLAHFGAADQGFDLRIESALPPERGMGSSAAAAVAITRAVYAAFDQSLAHADLLRWADQSEQVLHGNPSGLDVATASASQPQWFVRHQAPHPLNLPKSGTLLIADTGQPGQTKAAVAAVAARLRQDRTRFFPELVRIGQAVQRAKHAIEVSDLEQLGDQLNVAQTSLAALGVSSLALNQLIDAALGAGALGAKLTGSGAGGCMIALAADPTSAQAVRTALAEAGATATWQYDFNQSEA